MNAKQDNNAIRDWHNPTVDLVAKFATLWCKASKLQLIATLWCKVSKLPLNQQEDTNRLTLTMHREYTLQSAYQAQFEELPRKGHKKAILENMGTTKMKIMCMVT